MVIFYSYVKLPEGILPTRSALTRAARLVPPPLASSVRGRRGAKPAARSSASWTPKGGVVASSDKMGRGRRGLIWFDIKENTHTHTHIS